MLGEPRLDAYWMEDVLAVAGQRQHEVLAAEGVTADRADFFLGDGSLKVNNVLLQLIIIISAAITTSKCFKS